MEDYKNFLKKIEKLKLDIVEFEGNGVMKKNIYLSNYAIYNLNYCSIIIINHDKYTFSINNSNQKAWIQKKDIFLQPKGQE